MSKGHVFEKSSIVGRWGEEQVRRWFLNRGYEVRDVTADLEYQGQDIDLLVRRPTKALWQAVEIKADQHTTGNLYIERYSNRVRKTPGWLFYTKADYVFYYFVRQGEAVLFQTATLREWAERRLADFPRHTPHNGTPGQLRFISAGYTVPLEALLERLPGTREYAGLPRYTGGK